MQGMVKADESPFMLLNVDELSPILKKAYQMVLCAVKLLDIWTTDIKLVQMIPGSTAALGDWPAERDTSPTPLAPARNEDGNKPSGSSATQPESLANRSGREQINDRDCRSDSRSSQSHVRSGAPSALLLTPQPNLAHQRHSTSHRVSRTLQHAGRQNGMLVSEQLDGSNDAFLKHLENLINPPMQSRSSTEVLLQTEQAINSGAAFLAAVVAVWDRSNQRFQALGTAHDGLYRRIVDLAIVAQHIFQPVAPDGDEMSDAFTFHDGRQLIDAVTSCLRANGECVAMTRNVLEMIGDFEFESTSRLGISSPFAGTKLEPDHDTITIRPLSMTPPPPRGLPPAPPSSQPEALPIAVEDKAADSQPHEWKREQTLHLTYSSTTSTLPPLPPLARRSIGSPGTDRTAFTPSSSENLAQSPIDGAESYGTPYSPDVSTVSSSYTGVGSLRDSDRSMVTSVSTRASSPDPSSSRLFSAASVNTSFCGSQSTLDEDCEEAEATVLEKTYAHELVFNKDGQVTGGSLPALIERLTTHDSTPDALFVATFFLTFRLFATPVEFAQALIDRFRYVARSARIAGNVRLRVFNIFKGWLESHWRMDCDRPALGFILPFATHQLAPVLPAVGKHLMELATKVSNVNGPLVPRLISSIGKTNTSVASYVAPDTPLPAPAITKSQLTSLRNWKHGGSAVKLLDFDPLELARQITIKASRMFCCILPEELLATEWTKKSSSMAVNVRAMATVSTDLTNLVTDCILQLEDATKRAKMIKQWIKIGARCLELNNYDSLMAIIASLNSRTVMRLQKTWDQVSAKTKATLRQQTAIFESERNYTVIRHRLQSHVPPCLPFVGIYLTDLTFVDHGNPATRKLPGTTTGTGTGTGADGEVAVINFDKHVKTAKIISELQRFQIPYRLQEVPELQTWIQDQLVRVRSSEAGDEFALHRRSLALEPRETTDRRGSGSKEKSEMKIDLFSFFTRDRGA